MPIIHIHQSAPLLDILPHYISSLTSFTYFDLLISHSLHVSYILDSVTVRQYLIHTCQLNLFCHFIRFAPNMLSLALLISYIGHTSTEFISTQGAYIKRPVTSCYTYLHKKQLLF